MSKHSTLTGAGTCASVVVSLPTLQLGLLPKVVESKSYVDVHHVLVFDVRAFARHLRLICNDKDAF